MPERDLDLLIRAAEAAGEIALKHWKNDYKTWDKGDAGPVTEADLEVDAHFKYTLLGARPDHGWLSEESEDNPDRLSKRKTIIVDPIDGTRSFIAGDKTWAHSIAIVDDGRPVAAVVYLPALERMYTATPDGAFLNGQAIFASSCQSLDDASVLAPKVALDDHYWDRWTPGFARHFRPSLAYRLALVAEGRFDAMITLRKAWEWDIAAGALIAQAAGAIVSDRQRQPLRFNSASRLLDGVLTGNRDLHDQMASRLKS